MMLIPRLLFVLNVFLLISADPTGCTYDLTDLAYTCTASTWTLPLVLGTFTNIPQVLLICDINGELPSAATFSGFGSIATGSFDANVIPSLHIRCASGGSLIISAGTFGGMSHVKELKILDCKILGIPDNVFTDIGDVNFFGIEGGSVDNVGFNAFTGMDIQALTDVKSPSGTFSIKNSRLKSGQLPNGLLYSVLNIKHLVLDNVDLSTIQGDMIQASTKLISLSFNNNPFSSLPTNLFDKATSLSSVEIFGSFWDCSCENLWFLDKLKTLNITLVGDINCNSTGTTETTGNQTDYRAHEYWTNNCTTVDICEGRTGFVIEGYCLGLMQILNYSMLLVSLILSTVALCLVICARRTIQNSRDAKLLSALQLNGRRSSKVMSERPPKEGMPEVETKSGTDRSKLW